jgi:hypothetical protein
MSVSFTLTLICILFKSRKIKSVSSSFPRSPRERGTGGGEVDKTEGHRGYTEDNRDVIDEPCRY